MQFQELLHKRHSTRAFKASAVEEEKLQSILEAARSAPSAGNLQAWKVSVVRDDKVKHKLSVAALNQEFISQAPVVLVFFADPKTSAAKYGVRGEKLYCLQDATLAATFAWLSAVDLGLAACWVGAFDEDGVREILKVGENLQPIAILLLGYAGEISAATPRRSLKEIMF